MIQDAPVRHGCRLLRAACRNVKTRRCEPQRREIHVDGRARLSNFWIPAGGIATAQDEQDTVHRLLERAGFVKSPHSGLFHLLPLGVRVLGKLERLIDTHMESIGACKVSLSSLTTENLWRKSGRLNDHSEILRVQDRKNSAFFLAPTHEEEITTLVANLVHSYKETPLRLYQITRKYRDELRPRGGLLRAREFIMKDLYTFDDTPDAALETYSQVTNAYAHFFGDLEIPYLVAKASSGAMGGDMSHEYHFPSPHGEDILHCCENQSCGFVINEEIFPTATTLTETKDNNCPQCNSRLESKKSIEVGHTFHLGTRYSAPLSAQVSIPSQSKSISESRHDLQMGCHGIGLSRLIPAIASSVSSKESNTLAWPRKVAPFEVVVVPGVGKNEIAVTVYDHLANTAKFDVVLDDRGHTDFSWKMKDADMIGYPIIVVVGRDWKHNMQRVEVQWMEAGKRMKTIVDFGTLGTTVQQLLVKTLFTV